MKMPRLFSPDLGLRAVASQTQAAGVAHSPLRWVVPQLGALLGRSEIPKLVEVMALRPTTRVLIAGLSGFIVVVALVSLAGIVCVEMSAMSLPDWLTTPSLVSRSAVARSPAGFENIVQHPLFSRSRQGAAPVVLASAPVSSPPRLSGLDQNVTLKGVFISGGLAKGFLVTSENPIGVWVGLNEEIAGWRVVTVQPDQVQLNGQGEKLVLSLNAGGAK